MHYYKITLSIASECMVVVKTLHMQIKPPIIVL